MLKVALLARKEDMKWSNYLLDHLNRYQMEGITLSTIIDEEDWKENPSSPMTEGTIPVFWQTLNDQKPDIVVLVTSKKAIHKKLLNALGMKYITSPRHLILLLVEPTNKDSDLELAEKFQFYNFVGITSGMSDVLIQQIACCLEEALKVKQTQSKALQERTAMQTWVEKQALVALSKTDYAATNTAKFVILCAILWLEPDNQAKEAIDDSQKDIIFAYCLRIMAQVSDREWLLVCLQAVQYLVREKEELLFLPYKLATIVTKRGLNDSDFPLFTVEEARLLIRHFGNWVMIANWAGIPLARENDMIKKVI